MQTSSGQASSGASAYQRGLIESIPLPVFVKGVDGRYVDCNSRFAELLGLAHDDIIGRTPYDIVPAELAVVYEHTDQELQGGGDTQVFGSQLRHQDGTVREVVCHKSLLRDDSGAVVGVVGVLQDVTDARRAERERAEAQRAMAERETMYRQMFETNLAVKLLIDPADGAIVDANAAAARFYGYDLAVLKTMRITDINVLPADQVRDEMTRARAEDRLYFRFPHRLASGEVRSVEVYSGPVTVNGRDLLHSIIHDVTDRERAVRDLERSNADLQQFAYVASHDLQEPLRTVVSYLQLLDRRYRGRLDAEADEFIAFAVDAARRMSALIHDLLAYSRVETQGQPLAPLPAVQAVEAALANLHFLAEALDADIQVGPLPVVMGDACQLASLFQNLIGNALKYRHPERRPVVRVSADPGEGPEWVFRVADNGIGIAPEYHQRVFKIFQRLHSQAEYDGTGIGLALVRRIVGRHGGRVWVDSREGEGATFCFTLPAASS